jgi:hypothetical protein
MSDATYLRLSYGTSRGRDTYGYNIVRLTDETTGKTFRCMGGGYDMVGTVLADWAVETHQDALRELAGRAYYEWREDGGMSVPGNDDRDRMYGMYAYYDESGQLDRVSVDGGCGVESVHRILKAAGLELTRTYVPTGRNRGNTTGWLVESGGVES